MPEHAGDAAHIAQPGAQSGQRHRWAYHAACGLPNQPEEKEAHRRVFRLAEDHCDNALFSENLRRQKAPLNRKTHESTSLHGDWRPAVLMVATDFNGATFQALMYAKRSKHDSAAKVYRDYHLDRSGDQFPATQHHNHQVIVKAASDGLNLHIMLCRIIHIEGQCRRTWQLTTACWTRLRKWAGTGQKGRP